MWAFVAGAEVDALDCPQDVAGGEDDDGRRDDGERDAEIPDGEDDEALRR